MKPRRFPKPKAASGRLEPQAEAGPRSTERRRANRSAKVWSIVIGLGAFAVVGWVFSHMMDRRPKKQPTSAERPRAELALPTTTNAAASSPVAFGSSTNSSPEQSSLIELINQANKLLAQAKPAEALELLQKAEKLNPEDEDVHYNLGIALTRLGRNDEAIKEYLEALRIFPDYAEVENNYGNLLVRLGRPAEAVEHFEKAVKITPDYASAWNNYGSALQRVGRTNQAQECFEKALHLDTNYWQAHYNLATSYLQRHQVSKAKSEFQTVLQLEPTFTPAQQAFNRLQTVTNQVTPSPVQP
jgi:tetratricopeptide (TPR) repeat protein